MIGRRFHLAYTVQGVRKLLVRNGWSCQVPARRAMERDEDAVAGWVKEVGPRAEGQRRPVGPGWSSRPKPASPGRRRTPRQGHHEAAPRWSGSEAVPADASP
ncbi:winged helix-turn-helix domain-containing protein [Streptomyces sp. NPDC017448]|uniref:winged helix-turn-helix domain-containing protein n=1 Tax=Streptomyces sp. NPDC017448 TaxID=3364996 RepID=UPI0037931C40